MKPQFPDYVKKVLRRLNQASFDAYIVGGCVRDMFLGKEPNDWDVTTSALPDETKAVFADCKIITFGEAHGTIAVLMDGYMVEITTFRDDGVYVDFRHPKNVTFSKRIEDDLARRDFTVNAMAMDIEGNLVDLYHGIDDIHHKTIQTVGEADARFHEDALRILRALRFSSVLGFSIEGKTAQAIHQNKALLSHVSKERIREEFVKMLCGKDAMIVLDSFRDVIAFIIPDVEPCFNLDQKTKYHAYDVWQHALVALNHASQDVLVRLAVFFHDIGKPQCMTEKDGVRHFYNHGKISAEMAHRIMKGLRFDNDTVERVARLVQYHDTYPLKQKKTLLKLLSVMSEADVLRLVEVQKCDSLAHAEAYRERYHDNDEIPALLEAIKQDQTCFSLKQLAVNGNDLMCVGYNAGKGIGQVLNRLLEMVIDGVLPNEKEALLNYARNNIKK